MYITKLSIESSNFVSVYPFFAILISVFLTKKPPGIPFKQGPGGKKLDISKNDMPAF
jgi:hypothetical protein